MCFAGLPDKYPETLTYTASGTDVVVSWDVVECLDFIKETQVKRDDVKIGEPVVPPENSFTVSDCSHMGANYQLSTDVGEAEPPIESEKKPLGEGD